MASFTPYKAEKGRGLAQALRFFFRAGKWAYNSEKFEAVRQERQLDGLTSMASTQEVTRVLRELSAGDSAAPEKLMPLVYNELRRLAAGYLQQERPEHTLQATALVHEAYIRLVDWKNVSWQNRAHFFALAAQVMRRILVDHARGKRAEKRGSGFTMLALEEAVSFPQQREVDLIALDDALKELALFDPTQSRIVELRFFGGLTIEETAETTKLSPATIKREWAMAKAWLHKRIVREL